MYKIPLTVRLIPISFEIEVIYRLLKVLFLVGRDTGQARAKKTHTDNNQKDALARHFARATNHVITLTCHMTSRMPVSRWLRGVRLALLVIGMKLRRSLMTLLSISVELYRIK